MSIGSWINNNVFGGHVAGPPAAAQGGPPPDMSRLHMDVRTGMITDPVTGQQYVNTPTGVVAKGTPNVQQQSGNALGQAAGFYGQVPGYDQREAGAYGQEGQVGQQIGQVAGQMGSAADYLNGMVHGNGPTVAGTQLQTGLEQAQRGQLAQAAGASGANAALARMSAMGNTAQLQAQTNQQQAVARAGEQTNAINGLGSMLSNQSGAYTSLGNLTGNMVQQSQAAAGQSIGAGQALTNMAMQGEAGHEGVQLDASKAQAAGNTGAMSNLFNGVSGYLNAKAGLH